MTRTELKITVISDLHCKHTSSDLDDKKRSSRSTILYSDSLRRDEPPKHPVFSFLQEVAKEKDIFKSDVLLCPGDITDKIDHQGYLTGWSFLEEIQAAIEAPKLYATIGNHDVDSRRGEQGSEPFKAAKSIKHNYPIMEDEALNNFWLDQFCVIENDNYVILIFNSAHSHLSYDDAGKSYIDRSVITKMNKKLISVSKEKIKIALCHHHPIGQPNLSTVDQDVIKNGTDFLDMLCSHDFSIIIHGHKHEAKIRYYNSIVVFCAGSFSSLENLKETESDNVFHIIDFIDKKNGIIKTWYYGTNSGWHQKLSKKFPPLTGFGYNRDLNELARKVSEWFFCKSNGSNDLYSNLILDIKEIQFLIPADQEKIKNILATNFEIDFTYNENGIPKNISKIIN